VYWFVEIVIDVCFVTNDVYCNNNVHKVICIIHDLVMSDM